MGQRTGQPQALKTLGLLAFKGQPMGQRLPQRLPQPLPINNNDNNENNVSSSLERGKTRLQILIIGVIFKIRIQRNIM